MKARQQWQSSKHAVLFVFVLLNHSNSLSSMLYQFSINTLQNPSNLYFWSRNALCIVQATKQNWSCESSGKIEKQLGCCFFNGSKFNQFFWSFADAIFLA